MSLKAPWSAAQVEALNRSQRDQRYHPFTCGGHLHDAAAGGRPALVATVDGWRCPDPDCDYTQDWAHETMVRGIK